MKCIFFLVLSSLFFLSCSPKITKFDDATKVHQRIAVLPIQSSVKLPTKDVDAISPEQVKKLEIEHAQKMQNHIESMLLDVNMRVKVQSANVTNSTLAKSGIDVHKINDYDLRDIASKLGVDAVIAGTFDTEGKMSDKAATAIDLAKRVERTVLNSSLGSIISTVTSKAHCNINLYDSKTGDRLWSLSESFDSRRGDTIQDVISKLLKPLAYDHPYR